MRAKRTTQRGMMRVLAIGAILMVAGLATSLAASDSPEMPSDVADMAVDGVVDIPSDVPELAATLEDCMAELVDSELVVSEFRPIRVAILDFASAQGSAFTSCNIKVSPLAEAGTELSDAIATRMAGWAEYQLVDRSVVEDTMRSHKLSMKALQGGESLKKLAELLDVHVLLVGQTDGTEWSGKGHAGGSLYAAIQLITSESDVLWSIDGSVTDTQSARQLVPSLADDMMGRLYADMQAVESVKSMLALHDTER